MSRPVPAGGRRHVVPLLVCAGAYLVATLAGPHPDASTVRAETEAAPPTIEALQQLFENPPPSAAPMMRWWWFGPSVTNEELEREMRAMKAGGIGGFEIQPVYPLALDDAGRGIRTLPFLGDEFIDALRFVADRARQLGLRMDLTLGSGWPFGGPGVPIAFASSKLRLERRELRPGDRSVPVPDLASGEGLIAVFLEPTAPAAGPPARLPLPPDGVVSLPMESGGPGRRLLFFIASRTGMQVKRAAAGAEGFVLDHYDRRAVDRYLSTVGDRLMTAFNGRPPSAVFCDSLEAYEGDWTSELAAEFRARRGYDLTDHLATLVEGTTPEADDVRHDWGRTLSELVNERFFARLREWAAGTGTRLRAQAYGIPPATLSTNAIVDVPEGEGFQWTRLTATRWASSAAHLYGRAIASAETWTWLHSPAFRAGPLDLKAEADRHFLQGINQIVGHGWPYSAPGVEYPGWRFYAAGAFNDQNPWWIVMPDVMRYLQRVSFVLRQGDAVADVAMYLPTSDAWASFTPGRANLFEALVGRVGGDLPATLTRAGLAFDVVDDEALARSGRIAGGRLVIGPMAYRVVLLPGVERIPPATLQMLEAFAAKGGLVIATRRLPARAPGLRTTPADHAGIRTAVARLFEGAGAPGRVVADEREGLAAVLNAAVHSDVRFTPPAPDVGFVHRRLPYADVYFVANTSNAPVHTAAAFAVRDRHAEAWDPMTGTVMPLNPQARGTGPPIFSLELEPYGSRVLVFSNRPPSRASRDRAPDRLRQGYGGPSAKAEGGSDGLTLAVGSDTSSSGRTSAVRVPPPIVMSDGWHIRFPDDSEPRPISPLRSWTEDPSRRYFSGVATYSRDVRIDRTVVSPGIGVRLEFGDARPMRPEDLKHGMRAWLDAPVREAAVVWVNDRRAGSVWCPPYALEVTGSLHTGVNRIRIDVANLAVNAMAGRPLPSYRLLNARYGTRFEPQDMDKVQPVPAGLFGDIRLVPFAR